MWDLALVSGTVSLNSSGPNSHLSARSMTISQHINEMHINTITYHFDEYKHTHHRRGLNEDSSAWWPDLQDLRDEAIPLHHVLQLPGDVVYVGPGTAHWVQALVCGYIIQKFIFGQFNVLYH